MNADQQIDAERLSRAASWMLEAPLALIAIGLGAVQAWNHRFDFASEDIVSYLDIADAFLQGDWSTVVNGMWSPLYPVILAVAQAVLHWPPAWDACRVKLVNFVVFLAALACFRFFLHHLLLFRQRRAASEQAVGISQLPTGLLTAGGYLLFLWSTLYWTGLFCDTPDMSTAALVYLACGILLRMQIRTYNWLCFAALGAVLGLGYLSKAALFPLAFVFFVAAAPLRGGLRQALKRLSLLLLLFTITAAPYITALSFAKGRFTYGEAGRLSYAFWVEGLGFLPDHHWQGGPPGFGMPLHPSRQLYHDPALYEFAEPLGGTYPPWTDVSYWFEGGRVPFTPAKLLFVVSRNLTFYWERFLAALLGGFILFACAGGAPRPSLLALSQCWRIFLPAAVGLGAYLVPTFFVANDMLLQPSMRYIASFVVVLFALGIGAVRLRSSLFARYWVVGLALIGLLVAGGKLGSQVAPQVRALAREGPYNIHWLVAQALIGQGLKPGDRVAVIGHEYEHEFWARLARVKIIAQIPDSAAFMAKDAEVRASILRLVEKTGASAIVWRQLNGDYVAHAFIKVRSAANP